MEELLSLIISVFILYSLRFKFVDVPRGTLHGHIEADFEQKKAEYEHENIEVSEVVEETDKMPPRAENDTMQAFFALPAHLADKVDDVKVGDKWIKVVELSFIEVIKPDNNG